MEVSVRLKNPPSGANRWGLSVYGWTGEKSLGTTVFSIDGEATFDIPPDWDFPLRFWISVIYYPDGSVTVLHQAQSLSPDWPYYVEEFIPDYGSYFYNVATEQFEEIAEVVPCEISIDAPDSAGEGEQVSVSAQVTNIAEDSYPFRVRIYAVRDIYAVPEPHELIGSFEEVIGSGISKTYDASFIMPAWDTTVLVMVYRFIDYWDFDNSASKIVSLEIVPEYRGTISKKELEYDESRSIIPVY